MKILHLVPDTNLFIQCRDLGELDWSRLGEFDEIHLIVCRPVQREIDHQKQRGNDRIGRRARETHSMFREVIVGGGTCKLIRGADPLVRLLIDPSCLHNPALGDRLDYGEIDDRIVGCVDAYRKQHPDSDAHLLTHDSGPMASAQMLSVPCIPIPDNWLRPPEDNEVERENRRLRKKLADIENTEPRFAIAYVDAHGNEADALEFEWPAYEKLSDSAISGIMRSLTSRLPLVTDYGSHELVKRQVKSADFIFEVTETYTPASEHEITEYTKTGYPAWIERCECILRQLHVSLEKKSDPIFFSFASRNEGSRPGKDALVTITARGHFLIRPTQIEDDEKGDETQGDFDQDLSFPLPPKPPKGKLITNSDSTTLDKWNRIYSRLLPMVETVRPSAFPEIHFRRFADQKHDPNRFYYKPDRFVEPSEILSLECEQWRHGLDAESFEGELYFDRNAEKIHGSLECRIHAENLSIPVKKVVPVRGRPKPFDVHGFAQRMMEDLFRCMEK